MFSNSMVEIIKKYFFRETTRPDFVPKIASSLYAIKSYLNAREYLRIVGGDISSVGAELMQALLIA
jgi:hypothetical protein